MTLKNENSSRKPKVTAVVTTYDRPKLLRRAIKSVVNQDYENIECIVVDDCSPKREEEKIVKSFENEEIKYHRHEKNRGLSAARNTGIEKASGNYISFLDDDDEWMSSKIEKQVNRFEELSEEFALVYCWMDYTDEESGKVVREYRPVHEGYIFPETLDGQPIGAGSTLMVRKEVATEVKGFDESLPRGVDGDFIRRVCKNYKVSCVKEVLTKYTIGHGNKRITRNDKEGLKNAINGHKKKLEKFKLDLKKYPEKKRNISLKIAELSLSVKKYPQGLVYLVKSLMAFPFSMRTYSKILNLVKNRYI
ncbi:glycosyltransferase involved in cell wall biosynthesis [Salinibacter ruber]|uniref:glycosyltransferase family 2 protein n=1 Tax=Salinibacter ruber TaxID=146919 RepID=UPI002168F3F3|nr:glycosyltransferase family 2 protein [Salinibacter ruber]MCS3863266.1 glycosyltransferase involved in cell wall biosynthesis [Salinibacter ruber]